MKIRNKQSQRRNPNIQTNH